MCGDKAVNWPRVWFSLEQGGIMGKVNSAGAPQTLTAIGLKLSGPV